MENVASSAKPWIDLPIAARTLGVRGSSAGAAAISKAITSIASRPQLREHPLQLHRVAHVALDLDLAHHERCHAVELAGGHLLPIVPADLDRGVGGPVFLGHLLGRAVEGDRAFLAAE